MHKRVSESAWVAFASIPFSWQADKIVKLWCLQLTLTSISRVQLHSGQTQKFNSTSGFCSFEVCKSLKQLIQDFCKKILLKKNTMLQQIYAV